MVNRFLVALGGSKEYNDGSGDIIMRITLGLLAAVTLWVSPALAYENFIPLGQNYSPDNQELPELNTEQYRLNSQVDIYEAENYVRQRTAKSFSSQLERFSNDQQYQGSSEFIDY